MSGVAYDYAGLSQAIQDLLEDSFTDFTAFIDQLIGWGEARLMKDLNLELWDTIDNSVTTSNGNANVAKPTAAIAIRNVRVGSVDLEPRTREFIDDYNSGASSGQPRYYNETNETAIKVAPPPGSTLTVTYDLISRPKQIGAANDSTHAATTFLSTYYGDILVIACLIESERFELADDRVAVWQAAYAEKMPGAMRELERNRRAYAFGPPIPTPAPPQPAAQA